MLPILRRIPLAVAIELAMLLRDRWSRLEPHERARLTALLRQSRGRRTNLGPTEQEEFRRLLARLEPGSLGRELLPLARRLAMRRGRRF
ncbi:MAG: hypothetical protein M3P39_02890 [Actinomycetota bacterium]|jgi:hypothetical protein|nr:hypothetical protein [Actinomycetota bacterium]